MIAPKALADGRLLVFVGCDVNSVVAGGRPAAEVIRELAPGLHLVSADAPVFTMPNGSVLTLRYTFDGNGLPQPESWEAGRFTLMPAGGGEPIELGPNLLAALREQIPAVLGASGYEVGVDRMVTTPGELVRWMPRKKSSGTASSQPTTTPQPAGSAVRDEDIWVSFGEPAQVRAHIRTFELKVSTDRFSGLTTAWLSGGHQLDAVGRIAVRDGGSQRWVRVVSESRTEPLSNGVVDAVAEYRPLVGQPVTKLSSFFPAHLTWAQIRNSAAQAYRNAVRAGEANLAGGFNSAQAGVDSLLRKFLGTDVHGNWLAGFTVAGEIKSVFPVNREPAAARTAAPNPWIQTVMASAAPVQQPIALERSLVAEPAALSQEVPVVVASSDVSVAVVQPVAGVVLPEIVWQPRAGAGQVTARVGELWELGRRAVAAGSLSFGKLLSEVADALARARRLAKGQQGVLVESLLTLEAVVSAERLASVAASGKLVGIADVDAALGALRAAIEAQLLTGTDLRQHTDDVVRALAGLQELSADWAGAEAWPVRFSRWLAILHSGMTVALHKASVPRSVYDQHLQVLVTSGIALLEAGELSVDGLSAELGRLSLKSRHETEQRMWLSDIRYAIGSAGSATAVEAVRQRLDHLAEEQQRLTNGQAKPGRQQRASGTDDRASVWARETGERIEAVRRDIEQLGVRFPKMKTPLAELRSAGHVLELRRQAWHARELGYVPYKQAVAFASLAVDCAKTVSPKAAALAKEGFTAVRTMASFVQHADDPESDTYEADWQTVTARLRAAEAEFLAAQGGPRAAHVRIAHFAFHNNMCAITIRRALRKNEVETYLGEAAAVRKGAERSTDPSAARVTCAVVDGGVSDVRWAMAVTALGGVTAQQAEDRVVQLTGDLARERVVTGVTSPYWLMLMIAQAEQLRHLSPNPEAFTARIREGALRLVREVQAEFFKPSFAHVAMVNATSDEPNARVSAQLETVASAWVELVRFGFADVAVVRERVARTGVFGHLADAFRLPELGEHVQRLFELHLRVVAGPQRVSEGKKWRDSILDGIGQVVRGRKGKHPGDVAPPARYAGVVLDALVEAAGRQVPAPGADFEDEVRGVRAALQKLSAEWSYPVDLVVQRPARVPREPVPLSDEALAEVSGAVDRLAAMVPLVFDGALDLADYTTAAHQVARLVARQADLGLVLRAVVLALLGDRPLDPVPLQRTMEALLAFSSGGTDPGVDTVALAEDLGGIVHEALKNTTLVTARFTNALQLAKSEREWYASGYGGMAPAKMAALLGGSQVHETFSALSQRIKSLTTDGTLAVAGGLLPPDLLRTRLSEIPRIGSVLAATDRAQLDGEAQLAAVKYQVEMAGTNPVTERVFAQSLNELAEAVLVLNARPAPAAATAMDTHRTTVPAVMARIAFNIEFGGLGTLPRRAALMALQEEVGYRSALMDNEPAEAARRFGRWLGLLEHAGFDAYRIAPDVIRWSFVRLLDAKVPTGFEERVGLLAARLASPDTPIAELQPLDTAARRTLWLSLLDTDIAFRRNPALQSDGVEIGVGVVEVVERLAARRVPSVVSGTGPSVGLEDFR
ncbi:hypothetical protein, partial [Kitasatospora sp. NE20-6]|uniref:hypothetical protein n=1 Tax=Kitasatospora sp. NE20-6 TaxID=2859066 RepID=UPI0038B3ACE5